MKSLSKFVVFLCCVFTSSFALAENWQFGLGTGLYGLAINGDAGFNTDAGPIEFNADLNSEEVRDLMDSAFGFGGYAKKDNILITYSYGQIELEDRVSAVLNESRGQLDIEYKDTGAELALDYQFAKEGKGTFGVLVGVRYTKLEYTIELEIDGQPTRAGKVDDDWTDLLLGISHIYPLSRRFIWNTRADVGFGGSDGTFSLNTGISWRFSKSMTARLYGSIISHNYENDNFGDENWFYYEANKYGLGLSFLYHF